MNVCPACHREVHEGDPQCANGHGPPWWSVPGESVFGWQLVDRLGDDGAALYKARGAGRFAAIQFIGHGSTLDPSFLRGFRSDSEAQQIFSTDAELVRVYDSQMASRGSCTRDSPPGWAVDDNAKASSEMIKMGYRIMLA